MDGRSEANAKLPAVSLRECPAHVVLFLRVNVQSGRLQAPPLQDAFKHTRILYSGAAATALFLPIVLEDPSSDPSL